MQISPINQNHSSNFRGTIKPSPVLAEIKSYANKESLARFNTMLERIEKIQDGLIFEFSKNVKYKMNGECFAKITDYNIHKSDNNSQKKDLVYTIEEETNAYSSPETIKSRKSIILDVVTSFFENIFYKVDNKPSRPELL